MISSNSEEPRGGALPDNDVNGGHPPAVSPASNLDGPVTPAADTAQPDDGNTHPDSENPQGRAVPNIEKPEGGVPPANEASPAATANPATIDPWP